MTRPTVGNLGADLFGRARRDGLELFLDPGERARRWWGEGVGVVGGWPGQGQQGGKFVPRHPPGELPEPWQVPAAPGRRRRCSVHRGTADARRRAARRGPRRSDSYHEIRSGR